MARLLSCRRFPVEKRIAAKFKGTKLAGEKSGVLRLIAVFKLVKALSLILIGFYALKLIHVDAAAQVSHWMSAVGLDPDAPLADRALGKIAGLPPSRFKEVGAGSFVYAGLFLIEGTGLWLQKRWGEWVTVIITGSLIPFEIYELVYKPTIAKGAMLAVNLAVVVYLLVRVLRRNPGQR